ncbi:hypothetical protein [uncultured Microbacterium sp.]|uniref:Lipoprotein n=1 Tax=uncultured Microbacterium sp. TaxID=191216 RepID=A0A1Y5P6R1_9MICO|nr:hypothetical protein [uncultured Microbacterium sp.]SBS74317.1 exported hypothetical protein [uncultured Microbacterium sp.]
MKDRRRIVAAGAGLLLVLAGCATAPRIDLDDARAWLEDVEAAQSDGPGAAGTVSLLIDHEGSDGDGRLEFASPTPLVRADAQCFGGGTADVAVTLVSADGAESDPFDAEIPCDEDVHEIELDGTPASAAVIDAHGSIETYLHVAVIQGMVIER